QGVYVIHLSRSIARLRERPPAAGAPVALAREDSRPMRPAAAPPPVFSAGGNTAASSGALASAPLLEGRGRPEGRQKLAEVLASLKEERRVAKLLRSSERRDRVDEVIGPPVGAALGWSAEEGARVREALARAGAERRAALEQLQRGKGRAEVKSE